jgi:hypothetical protein
MPNRVIKAHARDSAMQLSDCLSSLAALELLAPSDEVYLISPWIGDVQLLDNRFGQYRALAPDGGRRRLTLSAFLGTLAERGARVRLICRADDAPTDGLLRRLPPGVEARNFDRLHEKGLVTASYYLRGSMNFTYSGINLNEESVELTTEPETVTRALLEARALWAACAAPCPA